VPCFGQLPSFVELKQHSFEAPFDYTEQLETWKVSGASIVTREHVLLTPNVLQRFGFMFSKQPLNTNAFNVSLVLKVIGTAPSPPQDQSFAFFYIQENITKSYDQDKVAQEGDWRKGLEKAGFLLEGMKNQFTGLGVFFTPSKSTSSGSHKVTAISSYGTSAFKMGWDIPSSYAKVANIRNRQDEAEIVVSVSPKLIQGFLVSNGDWQSIFRVDHSATNIFKNGYIGFTAFSGTGRSEADRISVSRMTVRNLDLTTIGESLTQDTETFAKMIDEEHRHFADQRGQAAHLQRVLSLIEKHVEEAGPLDKKVYKSLEAMNGRMSTMEANCKTLTKSVRIVGSGKSHEEMVDLVKSEIVGLKRALNSDAAVQKRTLEAVTKSVEDVKDKYTGASSELALATLAAEGSKLEVTVRSRSSQMSWMLFTIIGCVLVCGCLVAARMNSYEKKHFI